MIKKIVKDLESCLENDCLFAALALALTLPDICGKAEYPKEKLISRRYIDWYDKYIGNYERDRSKSLGDSPTELPFLSGELVYQLRCSFLHAGDTDIDQKDIHDEQNRH